MQQASRTAVLVVAQEGAMAQLLRKIGPWWTAVSLVSVLASCGDDVKVTNVLPVNNEPPRVIAQGPSYPSTIMDYRTAGNPRLFVVVADPNGLEDISAVLFSVDTAIVTSVTTRLDSLVAGFPTCAYSSVDTVDISSLHPSVFSYTMENGSMAGSGGVYSMYPFTAPVDGEFRVPGPSAFPRIDLANASFGIPLAGCYQLGISLLRFGVYPPAVPVAIEVSLTRMEVEYRGIHATVYDAAGASASTSFPPLRLLYAAPVEPNALAHLANPLPATRTGLLP
jgi:hypothetical protein